MTARPNLRFDRNRKYRPLPNRKSLHRRGLTSQPASGLRMPPPPMGTALGWGGFSRCVASLQRNRDLTAQDRATHRLFPEMMSEKRSKSACGPLCSPVRSHYTKRVGPWRSLVSASVWGAEGREFESRRPDHSENAHLLPGMGVSLFRALPSLPLLAKVLA